MAAGDVAAVRYGAAVIAGDAACRSWPLPRFSIGIYLPRLADRTKKETQGKC